MTAKVINFGSINIDHVYRVPHLVTPGETLASESLQTVLGGKGANQSVALARAGVAVCHVGAIGKQDQALLQQMSKAGVDASAVELRDQASGHAIIQVDQQGENSILIHGGANQSCKLEQLEYAINQHPNAEYVLLQNEINLLDSAIAMARANHLKVAVNPAPMNDTAKRIDLSSIDLLIVNQQEGESLSGKTDPSEIAKALAATAPTTKIALTLGSVGAIFIDQEMQYHQAAMRVDTVDTTAAGDTFVGYLLAGFIQNLSPTENLARAAQAASICVGKAGAIPSIPKLDELAGDA